MGLRIENSAKNIKAAWIMHFLHVLGQFISRTVIIMVLSVEYVGLSGLFSNILTMLSLAELGIGEAIVFSLYGPIARNEEEKIKSIMAFYKKVYILVGCFILIVGTALAPFIDFFINEAPDIPYIHLIYVLYVVNSAVTYFFSYRATFIRANQRNYIVSVNEELFRFGGVIASSIFLILTKNYIVYMLILIISVLLQNVNISRIAKKEYPYLADKEHEPIPGEVLNEIKKNTAAMVLHKIGSILVFATDNMIISKFLGLKIAGIYTNYYIITNAITAFVNKFFTSISASVGNLVASESIEKQERTLFKIFFIDFWFFTFICADLFALLNPFIGNIWLGQKFLLDNKVVLLIIISTYLTGMRRAVQTFKNAKGLYWQNKYMPIYEAAINLLVSVVLVKTIGVAGVLIGTITSTLLTCIWIEPHVLYKFGFEKSSKQYWIKFIAYLIVFFITIGLTFGAVFEIGQLFGGVFKLRSLKTLGVFCLQLVTALAVPNAILWIMFRKTDNYKELLSIVKSKFFKKK